MSTLFKPLTLLAVAAFSCLAILPFRFRESTDSPPYAFEVELVTDVSGYSQFYFDVGNGFSESDSARNGVGPTDEPVTVRFPLPPKMVRAVRFDPLDRPARVGLHNPRITAPDGSVIHRFTPSDFSIQQQIASLEVDAESVTAVITSPAEDPILAVTLQKPIALGTQGFTPFTLIKPALAVFACLMLGLLATAWIPRSVRERLNLTRREWTTWLMARPKVAVAMVALAAVILSSYPVVFLGKSFVSPNFVDGTYLLYGEFPTLPGHTDSRTEDAKGSDVGAITWAHIPYSFLQHRAVMEDGELPLWNRYNACGTVLLGQGQSMFGDPVHLLVILANGSAWAWDIKFLAAKWLLCCSLGLIVLRGTRHLPSAALAALSGAFLGFFLYRLNHPAFFSFCYAPWILYAWVRLADLPSLRNLAGWCGALVLACITELHSGTVKEAYMLLLGMNASGLLILGCAARPWKEKLRILAAAAWAGVIFVLLTAPTWLTFLDALKRAATSYDAPSAFQILPAVGLGLFDELFYRPLQAGERVFNPSANFLVLTGVLYFFASFRHAAASRMARAIAWSSLPTAALVFGLIPPQWIVTVPFIGNVAHIDNTFSCLLIIQLIVIAGFGWRAAFERLGTPEARGDLVRAGWGYVLLVVPWIAFTQVVHRPIYGDEAVVTLLRTGQRVPVSWFVWVSLLVLSLAMFILLLAARRALRHRRLDAAGVLLLALALGAMLWRHGVHVPAVGPATYVFSPGARVDFKAPSPAIAALKADQTEPGRVVGFHGNLFPGWASTYGIEGINGPDALMNPYYSDLVRTLGLKRIWGWRIFATADNIAAQKAAFDFLNVRHYLELRSDKRRLGMQLTPVKMADLDVYRSETAWPRAFFVPQLVSYANAKEFGAMVSAAGRGPFAAIQKDDMQKRPDLAPFVVPAATLPATPARDYRLTTNSTSFTVDASGPGMAVLHEAWLHRGFRAEVDGEAAEIVRVNHAFKGVAIPAAGPHRVEFTYRPRRFTLALSLSALGAVFTCGTGLLAWRRRKHG